MFRDGVIEIRFVDRAMQLVAENGATFPLPVGMPIVGPSIHARSGDQYAIRRFETGLQVDVVTS